MTRSNFPEILIAIIDNSCLKKNQTPETISYFNKFIIKLKLVKRKLKDITEQIMTLFLLLMLFMKIISK